MTIILIILGILTFIYALAIIFIAIGVVRLPDPSNKIQPKISIIVAFRNEERNITQLLSALSQQNYPPHLQEIILIDDASTDASYSIAQKFITESQNPQVKLLKSLGREKVISPKKHALEQGIHHAKGEILLFTDADCIPPPEWISRIISYFSPQVGMVIGFSPLEIPSPSSFKDYLLALESLSLASLAAGTTGWGRSATCTGRNLAYRKNLYIEVGGFNDIRHFISGDDDLFLKTVQQKSKWRIAYALHPESIVPTRTISDFSQFIHQRIRHASKGLQYGWKMTAVLIGAYLYNLLLLISIIFLASKISFIIFPILFWYIKTATEFILLGLFARMSSRSHYLFILPAAEIIHVLYVILFGALGLFVKIQWKK